MTAESLTTRRAFQAALGSSAALTVIGVSTVGRAQQTILGSTEGAIPAGRAASPARLGRTLAFPPDAGLINVRHFGAVGDGVTDDTGAIRDAIATLPPYAKTHPYLVGIIYFPPGVYRVTDTLFRRSAEGLFLPGLILVGDDRATTTIKLADGAPGFGDTAHPKAVILTASGLAYMKNPRDGGRDYLGRGEGNEAFANTVENLTIDVGRGNPGAIGIDFLSNNVGAVRNVAISAAGGAAVGLSMTRRWPGPALISDVTITGFDVGVDIAFTLYSITFDRVRIVGSTTCGIRNASNIVSFHDLQIAMKGGVALANTTPDGLMVGVNGVVSGRGSAAVANRGGINFKDVSAKNLKDDDGRALDAELDGVFEAERKLSMPKWRLSIETPPQPDRVPSSDWVNVTRFGIKPGGDTTAAFLAAFQSNAKVIYIPTGIYYLSKPIEVADDVERVEGMFSVIDIGSDPHFVAGTPSPLFRTSPTRRKPFFVKRLVVERRGTMNFIIEHRAKNATLVLSDIVGLFGVGLVYRGAEGGPVFADNTTAGHTEIAGPAGLWFRQYNAEGPTIRLRNSGAPLWILGAKSEQTNTLVQCVDGGNTEIVGGFVARVFPTLPEMPVFQAIDARVAASYAEDVYRPEAIYRVHLDARIDGKQTRIRAEDLPRRGRWARMAPSLSTDDLPR